MGGAGARIRLARFGRKNAPFYNIVVLDARKARNAKPIEVLGTYDPIPRPPTYGDGRPSKSVQLDMVRAKYWLGCGAKPTDTVWRLLAMMELLPPKFRPGRDPPLVESDLEGQSKKPEKAEPQAQA